MRIILSEKDMSTCSFPDDTVWKKISAKDLCDYEGNSDVVAIAGSRAMAKSASLMTLPSLKLFQLTSAGFDGVPLEEFASHGVAVANAGSVYSVPIAETVVFGILLMAKRLRKNPNNRIFKISR